MIEIPTPTKEQKEKIRLMKFDVEAMLQAMSTVTGWCVPEKAMQLYNLVLESNAQCIVELGSFYGRSFIPLAFACAYKQSGTAIATDAFNVQSTLEGNNDERNNEWWSKIDFDQAYQFLLDTLSRFELNHYTQVIKARSEDVANFFEDYSIDILHQDGNHASEIILRELELFTPKMKPHSYLICDDSNWPEARDGYARIPDFGFKLLKDFSTWQIWQKK